MTSTTDTGVADTEHFEELSPDAAVDAFAQLFTSDASKKKPSDEEGEETPESTSEDDAEEQDATDQTEDETDPEADSSDEDGEEAETDDAASKKYSDDDETFVKIKVGEDEHEVPVKDLKRLFGQEAALTKKSQEVAELRRAVEADHEANAVRLQSLLGRATKRADAYRAIPWLQLTKDPNVPADQLQALQAEAQAALEEESFLTQESTKLLQHVQQQRQTDLVQQAKETVKVLGDQTSPMHIEGWNQQLYGDMLKFAVDQGVPAQVANAIADAPTLKVLHMAMMFAKGQQQVTKVAAKTKQDKAPKRIVKTSNSPAPVNSSKSQANQKKAMQRLAKSGSEDDAIDAFAAMFSPRDDD